MDNLYVAITRPAMKFGVTMEALLFNTVLSAVALIGTGNPLAMLVFIPIHASIYLLSMKDPRIMKLLVLFTMTKARGFIGKSFFKVATFTPFFNTRNLYK